MNIMWSNYRPLISLVAFLFKFLCSFFASCALLASTFPAHSTQIGGLYSAAVPISSQQSEDRKKGFNEAFLRVLIKVSGDSEIINQLAQANQTSPAGQYVQTFSYRENPAYKVYLEAKAEQERLGRAQQTDTVGEPSEISQGIETDPTSLDAQILALENKLAEMQNGTYKDSEENQTGISATDSDGELAPPMPFLLEVSFAESVINKELTRLSVPIWGKTRPSTLIWIVTEDTGERRLLGDDEFEARDYLEQLSAQRGVPLYLPVADLEDVSAIDLSEVWALFPGSVDIASERYDADAKVMMRLYQNADSLWEANWNIQHRDILESREIVVEDIQLAMDAIVDHVAKMLSSRYAVLRAQEEHSDDFLVVISDIDSYKDYILVQRYLENLPPVAQTSLKWVSATQHGYSLILNGSPEQFFEHIELGKRLRRDTRTILNESIELPVDMENSDQQFMQQLDQPKIRLVWIGAE